MEQHMANRKCFFQYKDHLNKVVCSQTAYQKRFIFTWKVMKIFTYLVILMQQFWTRKSSSSSTTDLILGNSY